MENNSRIEEFKRVLDECKKNPQLDRLFIQKNIGYIYSMLETNPICCYEHMGEFERIFRHIESCLEKITNKVGDEKRYFYKQIDEDIRRLINLCSHDTLYNSEKYYHQQIEELQNKVKALNNELSNLSETADEYENKVKELEFVEDQVRKYKAEKDELEKKLDARETVKGRISEAFDELKKHTSHLTMEKKRLNWMFIIYALLCLITLVALIVFEWNYFSKWENADRWIDYLPFYLPVPIVGGLLWVFIVQMNRAQRQLMQVANTLYHIDYIEGLLLAINHINNDVNSASDKICSVLDYLIKNHISIPDGLSEQSLEAEISKDNINLSTFINLAKEVKEVVK